MTILILKPGRKGILFFNHIKLIIMNSRLTICKGNLCVSAQGKFAQFLIVAFGVALIAYTANNVFNNLKKIDNGNK